jgi:maleylpyruvate isomerase
VAETAVLDAIAAAEARLEVTVAAMTDEEAAAPSRLPGWDRAMVVTHVARNASSNAAMVAAALRGEERAQYPGGPEQRVAEIEAGRGRTASAVLADLRESAAMWAAVMATVGDEQWSLTVPAGVGPRPVEQRVRARLLEVEVHHADLGLGYTFRDWPAPFVDVVLPHTMALTSLRRGAGALPGSWGVGRWTVHVADDVEVGEGGDADGFVTGPDAGLLAWLLGRETVASAGLVVQGDKRVAEFPAWFPFP